MIGSMQGIFITGLSMLHSLPFIIVSLSVDNKAGFSLKDHSFMKNLALELDEGCLKLCQLCKLIQLSTQIS